MVGRKKRLAEQYRKVKRLGSGRVEEKLVIASACRNMRWDYQTYMSQPVWFVETLAMLNDIDVEFAEVEKNKLKRKNA